jgi:hypothetical protein
VVAAEVEAGAAAAAVVAGSVVAAVAGLLVAAEVAAAAAVVAVAAVGSVESGSVAAGLGLAGVAADPGERAACAKSDEKRVVTVGGSLPVEPNNQTNSASARHFAKVHKSSFLTLALDYALSAFWNGGYRTPR